MIRCNLDDFIDKFINSLWLLLDSTFHLHVFFDPETES
jgi:hypothetical protein